MNEQHTAETAHTSSVVQEIATLRAEFVDRAVERRVNHREGYFTTEQLIGWEEQAQRDWRAKYPALTSLLPSHLPTEEGGRG